MFSISVKKLTCLAATALFLCATPAAWADWQTLDVHWSGADSGNGASADALITLDTSVLPDPGYLTVFPSGAVSDLTVTVRGASAGNGTFGMGDFFGLYFSTPAPLDLHRELFGQPVGAGQVYGTADGNGGDFSLLPNGNSVNAPSGGFWFFTMTTAGGENMQVTSIVPVVAAVPEPASYALLLLGLAVIGAVARRKT